MIHSGRCKFCIDGFFNPDRLDRDRKRNGGELMIYVRDDIPSKMLGKHNLSENMESAFIELNFHKCKWLLCATYRSPSQNYNYFLIILIKV